MVTFESIAAWALALPEAVEADHFGAPSFRVAGKIFATVRRDPPRLMVKLGADDQHNLCQGHPDLIQPVPGYWGRKGATFVDYAKIDDTLAEMLLRLAWIGVAPKRLRQSG
ncbi:MAG TPA: MmcQ/YjbR family DNA-binding protein [Caulobacteraceae bacterium]